MNQSDDTITLANGADASADYDGIPYQLSGIRDFSIHVKFSDNTVAGTLVLQGSNDPTAFTAPGSADWVNVLDSDQTVTSGASHVWNVQGANYKVTRFVWTNASGGGTLTAWLEVKFLEG